MERLCFVGRVYVFLHPKASKKRAAQTNWTIQGRDNDGGGAQDFLRLRTQVWCYLVLLAFCSTLTHTDCVDWSLSVLSHYTKIRSIGSYERHALPRIW